MKISRVPGVTASLILAALFLTGSWIASNEAGEVTKDGLPAASPLPIGSKCTVHVGRGQLQESLTGTIQKLTDQWLVLTSTTESEAMPGVPILNKVPYKSRLFKNVGVSARKVEMWIPRDSVVYFTIEHEPVQNDSAKVRDVSAAFYTTANKPGPVSMLGNEAGELRDDNVLKMKFIWCPPGSVRMEQVEYAPGGVQNVTPVRAFLSQGYWIGRTEVTQAEWKQVRETEPWKCQPATKEGDELAATWVSWHECMAFCRKLTEQERKARRLSDDWEYTLPTEAQWERACRAQTETDFSFGGDVSRLGDYAWIFENTSQIGEFAHAVGQKKPNAWGLHDMHGNVYEWCRDSWTEQLSGGRDPESRGTEFDRVCRGGCFMDHDGLASRSSARAHAETTARNFVTGFRVALTPVNPAK